MGKIIELTHDDVQNELAYALICETMEGAYWNSGRRRRMFSKAFTRSEQQRISNIKADQKMYIYVTNAYDQNVCLGRGTRYDIICDEENVDDILPHMLDEVDIISVTPDGGLQILVRDAMYEKPLEEQYDKDYVATWKNFDKSTRPFRFGAELEDMQPVK